jgi:putative ABC transport system permease protein
MRFDMSKRSANGGANWLTMLTEGVRIASDAIRANRIRASLTILGVGIGVSVVVTMAALITGIRSSVLEAFEAVGPENFIVVRFDFTAVRIVNFGGRPPWWNKPELTPAEAARVGRLPGVSQALYAYDMSTDVEFEGTRIPSIRAQGISAGWPGYTRGEFIAGRDFTPAEERESRSLVVLSSALATDLFGQRDPVGQRVRLSSPRRNVREEFRVVGVFEPAENIFDGSADHWVIFPWTTGLKRLKASTQQAQIFVIPRTGVTQSVAQDQVIGSLRGARGLGPREENNFALLSSAQLVESFDQLTGVFFLVMLALSSAGLLVGGVGVIGIMLISVTERTREIGVRKALGATRREILWQFLVEAGFLTLLGGAAGLILGAVIAFVTAELTPIPARIPLWSVATALIVAALTGMLFGLLPAWRAARLQPVVALRAE